MNAVQERLRDEAFRCLERSTGGNQGQQMIWLLRGILAAVLALGGGDDE